MRARTIGRLAGTLAMVLGSIALPAAATLIASSDQAGAAPTGPACTDTWTNAGGGSWDTSSNWSTGQVPGSGDVACITAAGSYVVTAGNETITLTGLVVGGSSSSPTFAMGNGTSGYPDLAVTGETDVAGGTLSTGWDGTNTFGSVVNSGTFEVAASPYTTNYSIGSFTNDGILEVDAPTILSLPTNTSALDNTTAGTVSVASDETLAISSPSDVTALVDQDGLIENSGSLTVADELEISGGTICGTAPSVGAGDGQAGGTLSFDPTVTGGPACADGVATDQLFIPNVTATVAGTIPTGYTVTIGDGGSSYPHVTLDGVTNDGVLGFGWGGTLDGPLTNNGTFTVAASPYQSTWNTSGVTNTGTTSVNGGLTVSLADASTWTNTGTIDVAANESLALSSPSGQSATFDQNSGSITNNGTFTIADPLQVNGGTVCGNPVVNGSGDGGSGATLSFAAKPSAGPACASGLAIDQLFIPNVTGTIATNIPKSWTVGVGDGGPSFAHVAWDGTTNAGTLSPAAGAVVNDANAVTNTGTILVPDEGYTTSLNWGGLTSTGKFTADSSVSLSLPGGSTFATKTTTVGASAQLSTNVDVISTGALTLGTGSQLSTGGTFAESGAKTVLDDQVGASGAGVVAAQGTATITGVVDVASVKGFTPDPSASYPVVTSPGLSGAFSEEKGAYPVTVAATSVTAQPLFTSSPSTTFTIGQYSDFKVTTGGSSPVAITSTSKLPTGVTFTPNPDGTADIAGTPICPATGSCATAKAWKITLKGIVDQVKGSQALVLTVDNPPSFTSAATKSVKAGSNVTISVKATGYPVPGISAAGLPDWLSAASTKAGTLTLSGTAPAGSQGTYDLSLEAVNALDTAHQTFTLTVK